MKKLILTVITIVSCAVFARTLNAQDINLANLSADDVKAIRKIIADRDYFKGIADDRQEQLTAANTSVANWRTLYLSEKDRADRVQGGRVNELQQGLSSSKDLNQLNATKLAENEFTIRKLKSERKWYVASGFVVGAAAGGYVGNRFGCRP